MKLLEVLKFIGDAGTFCKGRKRLMLLLALGLGFSGCVNLLNERHWNFYNQAGIAAEKRGDYELAQRNYLRGLRNAEAGFLGNEAESQSIYNWARMTGMLGNFEQAEEGFKKALKLEEKVYGAGGGHASMRWFELARLYFAWGRYADSVSAYEMAFPLADQKNAKSEYPLMYAQIMRDYADALEKSGEKERAALTREKAGPIQTADLEVEIMYYPTKLSK